MHKVSEIRLGEGCTTCLWFSEAVLETVAEFRKKGDPNGAFWKKLQRVAKAGFRLYQRGDSPVVVYEWDQVFRFGVKGSLFRIIGFFEDNTDRNFIAIDAWLKRGQKLNTAERARIDEVARVRSQRDWKKVIQ